jgi:FG-GAP repeat protein
LRILDPPPTMGHRHGLGPLTTGRLWRLLPSPSLPEERLMTMWKTSHRAGLALFVAVTLAPAELGSAVAHAHPVASCSVDRIVEDVLIKASNAQRYDFFGTAVAMDGDTLVVGARNEASSASGVDGNQSDEGAFGCGAAYVFVKSASGWTQQAYLKPSNPLRCLQFGSSVDIDGDTIVIGAEREFSSATGVDGVDSGLAIHGAGAAYIFERSGATWSQVAHLKPDYPDEWDYFGCAVAVSNGTVVVGSEWEDGANGGVNGDQNSNAVGKSGAAYVFARNGSTWSSQAYLKLTSPAIVDYFGSAVDVSGETIVVGAWGSLLAPPIWPNYSDGQAVVFTRSGSTWSQQQVLDVGMSGNASFGQSVAIDGDTILVGAPGQWGAPLVPGGPEVPGSGAAHVFVRHGGSWTREGILGAEHYSENDNFGWSVAIDGNRVVVGADGEGNGNGGVNPVLIDDSHNNSGAAYAFERIGTVWQSFGYLKAPDPEVKDYYGDDVAIAGHTVIVGVFSDDSPSAGIGGDPVPGGAKDSGAAYTYEILLRATSFCFGDGTGLPCPCSNEGFHGQGCANSTGRGAVLYASGTSVVANDDLQFHIVGARPSHPGLLVQGGSAVGVPFKDGLLCAGNPNERLEILTLDPSGAGSTTSSIATTGGVSPGQLRYYQFWYRDTGLSVCSTGSNFTQGLIIDWI